MIKDSGNRKEFDSGAVRDIQEGKGRCDLLPLKEVSDLNLIRSEEHEHKSPLFWLSQIDEEPIDICLILAADSFLTERRWSFSEGILELAKHFEEGAKKYGDNNWRKGIPLNCYIDSGIRHYLKWKNGMTDESHDRAFLWNMLCGAWEYRREQNGK